MFELGKLLGVVLLGRLVLVLLWLLVVVLAVGLVFVVCVLRAFHAPGRRRG